MRKIITTKDQDVCGGIREEPEIIVGGDKAVTDAVVYLAKVDKGKAWPAPGAEAACSTTRSASSSRASR